MATAATWDREVDLLVAGTGAAAMAAAIAGKEAGSDVLIVESTPYWGGTTSWSGGGVWAPANKFMARDGSPDSREEALRYMETVIAEVGAPSTRARKLAFLEGVTRVVDMLEAHGVKWARGAEYPDYYPNEPGGKIGRTLEVWPFDTKQLGDWWTSANNQRAGLPGPIMTDDVWLLARAWTSWDGWWRGARVVFRTIFSLLSGKRSRGMGGAISSAMFKIILDQGTPVLLSTPIVDLVVEQDAVVGAIIERDGRRERVRARQGVVLGAGGFANRGEWREKYQGVPGGWSSAPEGDQGTAIEIAEKHGAALAMMDDAWWGASIVAPAERPQFSVWERSMPHSIIVDSQGDRFVNESASYIDVGHAINEHNREVPSIPAFLISDATYKRRYLNSVLLTGTKKFFEQGMLFEADTIEELAAKIGVPPERLAATVRRFNGFAATGVDLDFHRGETAYDNYYSDPWQKPNPNLGAIAKGPFRAMKVVPGDLGTKGGVVTDEHARVLRENGSVIEGLYAAGNTTASVMGRTYPGPGSTLGPALAFGYLGARHAAGVPVSATVVEPLPV